MQSSYQTLCICCKQNNSAGPYLCRECLDTMPCSAKIEKIADEPKFSPAAIQYIRQFRKKLGIDTPIQITEPPQQPFLRRPGQMIVRADGLQVLEEVDEKEGDMIFDPETGQIRTVPPPPKLQ